MSCKGCNYGSYDPCSDICEGCRNDPDTGWGGFTDHMLGKHFNTNEERDIYIDAHTFFGVFEDDEEDF